MQGSSSSSSSSSTCPFVTTTLKKSESSRRSSIVWRCQLQQSSSTPLLILLSRLIQTLPLQAQPSTHASATLPVTTQLQLTTPHHKWRCSTLTGLLLSLPSLSATRLRTTLPLRDLSLQLQQHSPMSSTQRLQLLRSMRGATAPLQRATFWHPPPRRLPLPNSALCLQSAAVTSVPARTIRAPLLYLLPQPAPTPPTRLPTTEAKAMLPPLLLLLPWHVQLQRQRVSARTIRTTGALLQQQHQQA